jgi:acyl-CoA hydrolase
MGHPISMAREESRRQVASTEFGLPIDHSFGLAAADESIRRVASALEAHGFTVKVVGTLAEARTYVHSILPKEKTIFTASSETLRLSGIEDDINKSGNYTAVRPQLEKLHRSTQMAEIKRLSSAPDVAIGSVHAITEDGKVLVGSGSGSQLSPYVYGAGKVIWVVGSQKLVPDVETGLKRLQLYSYPKEDLRMRERYGMPSGLNKILIINGDRPAGRSTVVLVREPVGF